MRRATKIDANQPEIVEVLRRVGACVAVTSHVGRGFPDLVVTFRNRVYLIEIKDGRKPASARTLTKDEVAFAREHPVFVVTNVREALAVIGLEAAV